MQKTSVVKSAVFIIIFKPVALILGLIYTPLLLSYLGNEKYGVWVTILSIVNWINYCDIGIGNGLRNVLTRKLALNENEDARKAISTGYLCLTVLMSVLLFVLSVVSFTLDWKSIFNTDEIVNISLWISFVFICVNFVLGLCNTLLYAMQRAEIVSLQSILVQGINIVGVIILGKFTEPNLAYVAILFGLSTFIIRLLSTAIIFQKHSILIPKVNCYDKKYQSEITSLGVKFFVAQIAALVLYTTDNLMVSNLFGAAEVTPFSITDSIFNAGYMVFASLTVPFWSKTTQEIAQSHFNNVKKYFGWLNALGCFFAVGCIAVVFIFRPLVRIWLRNDLYIPGELIIVMAIYYIFHGFCGVSSPFINGMGGVNGAMILGIVQGVLNIPLSLFFAIPCKMGVVGIRIGTLSVVVLGAIFQFIYFYILIQKLENTMNEQI